MVSISPVQQKSCSSLQQRNQNVGNKANNISQKVMTAPSFTGDDHLSAMGKAQVFRNGSKVPFKGCCINRQINEAIKREIKNPTEIGAEGRVQQVIVKTLKKIWPSATESQIEIRRQWEGHPPTKPDNLFERLWKIRERQVANGSAKQYENDHLERHKYYTSVRKTHEMVERCERSHPLRRYSSSDSGSDSGRWDGYIEPCCYGL